MLKHLALLTVSVLAFSGAASMPATAQCENLPIRTTPRPATTTGVPHVQIDVVSQPDLAAALLSRVAELPDVEIRETVISLPGAKGFWLADDLELARPEAIVGGREFAHMHPDGSLHASLSPAMARAAVEAGWATPHPWADQRPGWEGFVLVYTPASDDELDVVFQLVSASYGFVTGRSLQ